MVAVLSIFFFFSLKWRWSVRQFVRLTIILNPFYSLPMLYFCNLVFFLHEIDSEF